MGKGYGTFRGVSQGWHEDFHIDASVIRNIYEEIRNEAKEADCLHFPGRDDIAASDTLFNDVVQRYEKRKGSRVPQENYQHFRRWILLLFKGGDMPS